LQSNVFYLYTQQQASVKVLNAPDSASKGLTTARRVACVSDTSKYIAWIVRLTGVAAILIATDVQGVWAQREPSKNSRTVARSSRGSVQTATIHWQDVPLRDALGRLAKLFGEVTFLDRRIDPTVRVNLDMSASSVEQVLRSVGAENGWSVTRVGDIAYLGPDNAAQHLNGVVAARKADVAKLPQSQRAAFARRRSLNWPRLAEPRAVATELVKKAGWRFAGGERIPHDLWAAGQLNGMTPIEQLAVLLIGFDLTFEIQGETRTIQIVDLDATRFATTADGAPKDASKQSPAPADEKTRQVYSLRVAEQPVGGVIRALGKRLNWQIEIDEAAIAAAGRSLEERVSFAVENVDQDELLDAVLRPAGLTYRREGDVIKIVPR
jgi:hypothetical protein